MREVVQWSYARGEAVRTWIIGRGVSASAVTVSRALERWLRDPTGSWRNGSGSAPEPNVSVANHLERAVDYREQGARWAVIPISIHRFTRPSRRSAQSCRRPYSDAGISTTVELARNNSRTEGLRTRVQEVPLSPRVRSSGWIRCLSGSRNTREKWLWVCWRMLLRLTCACEPSKEHRYV